MNEEKKYPISEIFTSPQGEGVYTGTMMTFIRLAGCTVGKPYPKEKYVERYSTDSMERPLHLPIYTEQCTLYDGRTFACDTDYRVKERLTTKKIIELIPKGITDVCITGGEPLMHDLDELVHELSYFRNKKVHIETSGTIHHKFDEDVWITLSPKKDVFYSMLLIADELKFLVDKNFDPLTNLSHDLCVEDWSRLKPTYLHPVNFEHTIDPHNLRLCKKWQEKYPSFRIGIQMHKAMTHYIGELVR